MRVAFLALGTRGDVAPLVGIARHLCGVTPGCQIVFVTHADLHDDSRDVCAGWEWGTVASTQCASNDKSAVRDQERESLVAACERAVPLDGIVFNLFALEGLAIAESLGINAVAVTTFWPPTPPAAMLPVRGLLQEIRDAMPDVAAELDKGAYQGANAVWCWADLEVWLWRVLLDDHGDWRARRLGLAPSPFVATSNGRQVPACISPVRLLSLVSPLLLLPEELAAVPEGAHVHMTGSPSAPLDEMFDRVRDVYIGFGSIEGLGLLDLDIAVAFLAVLQRTAGSLLCHSTLATGGVLSSAAAKLGVEFMNGVVNLDEVFSTCTMVIHAGGAGTVAAAARLGIPQIIVPFHFDQHDWASRVVSLGIGSRLPPLEALLSRGSDQQVELMVGQAIAQARSLCGSATLVTMARQLKDESQNAMDRIVHALSGQLQQ